MFFSLLVGMRIQHVSFEGGSELKSPAKMGGNPSTEIVIYGT
jgi:hypothetical protein